MTHDPSSPSKLLATESRTSYLGAIAQVLFCPKFLVPDKIFYQNAWQVSRVSGTRFCYL